MVESDDEARDSKRSDSSTLRVLLLANRVLAPFLEEGEREGGRTCWIWAMWRVMYSTETGSSTVRRWDWHSIRARSMRMRASAVRPARRGEALARPGVLVVLGWEDELPPCPRASPVKATPKHYVPKATQRLPPHPTPLLPSTTGRASSNVPAKPKQT